MLRFDLVGKIVGVVNQANFAGANDEFNALKTSVLSASVEDIDGAKAHADVVLEFLVGFVEKKNLYRQQVAKVVRSCLAAPGWHRAYAARPDLHARVAGLHEDLQSAFNSAAWLETAATATQAPAPTATSTGPSWPDWDLLRAAVAMEDYNGAVDEFLAFRKAVAQASVEELELEAARAQLAWGFLVGLAERKPLHRSLIVQVVWRLGASPLWQAALAARGDLCERAQALHPDLAGAFTLALDSVAPGEAPAASGTASSNDRSSAEDARAKAPQDVGRPDLEAQTSKEAKTEPAGSAASHGQPSGGGIAEDTVLLLAEPFLRAAKDLADNHPIVAHYCRVHGIELLVRAGSSGRSSATKALLLEEFQRAESEKERLDLSTGRQTMEAFALKAYEAANRIDAAESTSFGLPEQLATAGHFLEVLAQLYGGELPKGLADCAAYANSRASHVREAKSMDRRPDQPMPPAAQAETWKPAPVSLPAATPMVAPAPMGSMAAQAAQAPTVAIGAGWTPSRRRSEAKKRADLAVAAIGKENPTEAARLIRESLALLEGL
mmetsp:Transcript_64865/g.141344  ORF Transcript_64865/g.141344 Transcript_64865/m.141344 type:complete len:552 (-) Transcript_64865:60-1715(-)